MIINQLSVFLENRTGQLAEITGILASAGIDMKAINIAEAADYGVLRLIADDSKKAYDLLKAEGFVVSLSSVVGCNVPNVPGGLNKLVVAFSENSIGIEYMYSVFGNDNGNAFIIMKVSDNESAEKVLSNI